MILETYNFKTFNLIYPLLSFVDNVNNDLYVAKSTQNMAGLNVLGDTNAIININAISKFNI